MSTEAPMHSTTKLRQITTRLRKVYGPRQRERNWDNPLDAVIHTILSQNASPANGERAYAGLRQRFKTWEEVWQASLRDLIAAIRAGGLASFKAVRIKAFLEEVRTAQGHFDLSFLRDLADDEVRAFLGRFKGISGRTRSCVLLFGLGRAAFPVDAHVYRVCRRLGLLNGQATPEKAQIFLESLVRSRDCLALHLHLVEHSRQVCTAHHPSCGQCVLMSLCDSARVDGETGGE
jgi:endonuclease III